MISNVYSPFNLKVRSAKGIELQTDKGVFIDTFSGIGVLSFGHSNEEIINAITEQVNKYAHLSNYFLDDNAVKISENISKMIGKKSETFFTNSGTESTEAAIKAVKKNKKGKIVSFNNNFHGRTCASLSITYNPKIREPFEPLADNRVFLPLEKDAFIEYTKNNEIAGVFLECVQGNSGVFGIDEDLINTINKLKTEKNYFIVCDEVQAGLGRTGKFFSYQNYNIEPDIVTLAKALGGGLPLGAAVFINFSPFGKGDHGSTFAPNPVSLASGKVVIEKVMKPGFLDSVKEKGKYFSEKLRELNWVNDVREYGLMIGVSTPDSKKVKEKAFENRVLLNIANDQIRFLPALNITHEEIDMIIEKLDFEV
ncbi:MAG: acetylornithine/N-succinyldiaminopimelate aminotransferase [Kosmotogales bacterium]|nr:acetylornithine/N-succinyldiaminopimelate aminotransferase [Kosmotogales bacterium]